MSGEVMLRSPRACMSCCLWRGRGLQRNHRMHLPPYTDDAAAVVVHLSGVVNHLRQRFLPAASDAQTLLVEIEVAKLSHPTPCQDASFISRASALNKRLLLRGNPASSPMAPPTPESPTTTLPTVSISPCEVVDQLVQLRERVTQEVSTPLSISLREYFIQLLSSHCSI